MIYIQRVWTVDVLIFLFKQRKTTDYNESNHGPVIFGRPNPFASRENTYMITDQIV